MSGRRVLLGVTGSIAAYKAAELVRLLVKAGDEVTVVMTPAACRFVQPLTFQTLSRNRVYVDQFAPPAEWKPEHVALADAADLVVVAPATANTLAKMRHGIAAVGTPGLLHAGEIFPEPAFFIILSVQNLLPKHSFVF